MYLADAQSFPPWILVPNCPFGLEIDVVGTNVVLSQSDRSLKTDFAVVVEDGL
jgi:hypothetical protein